MVYNIIVRGKEGVAIVTPSFYGAFCSKVVVRAGGTEALTTCSTGEELLSAAKLINIIHHNQRKI